MKASQLCPSCLVLSVLPPYHVLTYSIPLASLTLVGLATGSPVSPTDTAVQITVAPLDRTPTQHCQQRDTLTNTPTFLPITEDLMENSITMASAEKCSLNIFIAFRVPKVPKDKQET